MWRSLRLYFFWSIVLYAAMVSGLAERKWEHTDLPATGILAENALKEKLAISSVSNTKEGDSLLQIQVNSGLQGDHKIHGAHIGPSSCRRRTDMNMWCSSRIPWSNRNAKAKGRRRNWEDCASCNTACGHRLVTKSTRNGVLKQASCRAMASRYRRCNGMCFVKATGLKPDPVTHLDKSSVCTVLCQEHYNTIIPGISASLVGYNSRTSVVCNFYKTVDCTAVNERKFLSCARRSRARRSRSATSSTNTCEDRTCSVRKEISCAAVCKMGNNFHPVLSTCTQTACNSNYCSTLGTYM